MEPGKIIKTFKSKKGREVVIRYPKWEDLEEVLKFANNLAFEDTFVELQGPISKDEEIKWLADTIARMEQGKRVHLVASVNGQYAGNCEIRVGEKRRRHVGEIGISVAKEYRQEGIGTELLRSLIEEGKKLGLKLLLLYCFETNARAIHVYETLGFKRAGLVPGVFAYKDDFVGEVTMYLPLT